MRWLTIFTIKNNFNTIRLLLITDYKVTMRSEADFSSEKVFRDIILNTGFSISIICIKYTKARITEMIMKLM